VISFSIIKRFEDRIHTVPMRERIDQAKFRLQAQYDKLEQTYARIQQRDKDLFQRCIGAQLSNDSAHARIYANECAEIRKIAKVVLGSELALERVILRLETVREFGAIWADISPVLDIVKDTKSKIAGIVPQVASELDEVNNLLEEMTMEEGVDEITSTSPAEATDAEAKKILEETGVIAEEKLKEHFPELPPISEHIPQPSLEPATGSSNNGDIQDEVFRYARGHPTFNISSCASELGRSPDEIRSAIDKLRDNGKLMIE
jgi:division protein CdvB (Snf7/Vps24/ESCRT-III family)